MDNTENDIKISEAHLQTVTIPASTRPITLGQLRSMVAAAEGWPDHTSLVIKESALYGAAPTLILRRDLLAADQATEEN